MSFAPPAHQPVTFLVLCVGLGLVARSAAGADEPPTTEGGGGDGPLFDIPVHPEQFPDPAAPGDESDSASSAAASAAESEVAAVTEAAAEIGPAPQPTSVPDDPDAASAPEASALGTETAPDSGPAATADPSLSGEQELGAWDTARAVFSCADVYTGPLLLGWCDAGDVYAIAHVGPVVFTRADGDVYAIAQLGLVNSVEGDFVGLLQSAPPLVFLPFPALANFVGGDFVGIQLGWYNDVGGSVYGWQGGALTFTRGDLYGLQTGTVLFVEGDLMGLQNAWILNKVDGTVYGAQLGAVNWADEVVGVQIGLINRARLLYGVQIGALNLATNGILAFMPVMNVGW